MKGKISLNGYIAIALALQLIVLLIRLLGFMKLKNYALLFESFHVLGDILITAVVLASIKITSSRMSKRYAYGLYRIEDLVSLAIAAIIAFTAIDILVSTITESAIPNLEASMIEFVSIVPLFFSGNVKVIAGKLNKSPSLTADGYHNYSDVYVGVGVGVGLLLNYFTKIAGFYYAAILFAVAAILYAAVIIGRDSVIGIMDLPKDKTTVPKIGKIVERNRKVKDIVSVKARWAGPVIFVELVIRVESKFTIEEAHLVADEVEEEVKREIPYTEDVVIHIEPSEEPRRNR